MWFADESTSGGKLTFKLDTGAEVSVLSRQVCQTRIKATAQINTTYLHMVPHQSPQMGHAGSPVTTRTMMVCVR